jgi:thiosulfate dehydrogenase [quinone] large subunit
MYAVAGEKGQVRTVARIEHGILTGTAPGWPLGLARIVVGWLWATQLMWKMPPLFGCGPELRVGLDGGLCDWVGREIANPNPYFPWYADFLQAVVVPNFVLFGWMVWLLEAFIFVSLFFGIFARLGGLAGTVQGANLTIGLSAVPHEWYWTYVMLTVLCALPLLTGSGRFLGLDYFLEPRLARLAARGGAFRLFAWLA